MTSSSAASSAPCRRDLASAPVGALGSDRLVELLGRRFRRPFRAARPDAALHRPALGSAAVFVRPTAAPGKMRRRSGPLHQVADAPPDPGALVLAGAPAPAHPRPCRRHPRSARRAVSTPDFRLHAPDNPLSVGLLPPACCSSSRRSLRLGRPPGPPASSPRRACIAVAGAARRRIEAARAGPTPGREQERHVDAAQEPVVEPRRPRSRLGRTLAGAFLAGAPALAALHERQVPRGRVRFQVVEEAQPRAAPFAGAAPVHVMAGPGGVFVASAGRWQPPGFSSASAAARPLAGRPSGFRRAR